MFACAAILGSVGSTMTSVWLVSIRQVACPSRLLSRVTASQSQMLAAVALIGAAGGGFLVASIGSRATLVLVALGRLAVLGALGFASIGRIHDLATNEVE